MTRLNLSELFKRNIKTVSLFGFGRGASALLPHLLAAGYAVTVRDDRDIALPHAEKSVKRLIGQSARTPPDEDLIIFSPSVRREDAFRGKIKRAPIFTSDTEIFFKLFSGKSFLISGSSGKSTSSVFLFELMRSGGAHLLGNIGVPMTPLFLTEKIERAVCEISSFNLQYDKIKPYRATVTNIQRNHLNWHKDFSEYQNAKLSLLSSALECSVNFDDDILREFASYSSCFACYSLKYDYNTLQNHCNGKTLYTLSECGVLKNGVPIIDKSLISGLAPYNIYNLLSALSLADGEYDESRLTEIISSHKAPPHRCEIFCISSGRRFIDSSIDTSPDRTVQTLKYLSGRIILLLGGRTKGESYKPILPLIKEKCRAIIVFGEAKGKIISDIGDGIPYILCDTMADAAGAALRLSAEGETVLLSPASTSHDEFSSFEERGEKFKKIIKDALRQKNTGDKNEKVN